DLREASLGERFLAHLAVLLHLPHRDAGDADHEVADRGRAALGGAPRAVARGGDVGAPRGERLVRADVTVADVEPAAGCEAAVPGGGDEARRPAGRVRAGGSDPDTDGDGGVTDTGDDAVETGVAHDGAGAVELDHQRLHAVALGLVDGPLDEAHLDGI